MGRFSGSQCRRGYREQILDRDNRTCQLCGATEADGARLEVDHIVPWRTKHDNSPGNLRCLCTHCNRYKAFEHRRKAVSWEEMIARLQASL